VLQQTRVPDEIVVVDSGSTDATLAIASAFPTTIIRISPREFSFGRALNAGVGASTGEIAIMASAHVYPVYDTWVEQLIAPFADESVALAYGRQQTPANGRFSEQRLLGRWFPPTSVARQRDPFCNNANAAIRRSLWERIPYDERLTGLEDIDWAKKALSIGNVLSYVAEAPVAHVHDETFAQVVNRYRREAIAHKQIYSEQRMGLAAAVALAAANVVGDIREAGRRGVLRENMADIPRFRVAQFYGTYRGFRQQGPVTEGLRQRFYYPPESEHAVPLDEPGAGRVIDYEAPLPDK
jgi:glycosyltransferase involved in cell wall biosynthesis